MKDENVKEMQCYNYINFIIPVDSCYFQPVRLVKGQMVKKYGKEQDLFSTPWKLQCIGSKSQTWVCFLSAWGLVRVCFLNFFVFLWSARADPSQTQKADPGIGWGLVGVCFLLSWVWSVLYTQYPKLTLLSRSWPMIPDSQWAVRFFSSIHRILFWNPQKKCFLLSYEIILWKQKLRWVWRSCKTWHNLPFVMYQGRRSFDVLQLGIQELLTHWFLLKCQNLYRYLSSQVSLIFYHNFYLVFYSYICTRIYTCTKIL